MTQLALTQADFEILRNNLVKTLGEDLSTNLRSLGKQNHITAKALGYGGYASYLSAQKQQAEASLETSDSPLILTLTQHNLIKDIVHCKSVTELESRFAQCIIDEGIEPTDVDFDNGYFKFESGITVCMNTAYPSDEPEPVFEKGYASEEVLTLPMQLSRIMSQDLGYNEQGKAEFHSVGKKALKELVRTLKDELGDFQFDLRSNLAGIAVSGEITLHTDRLYLQVSQFFGGDQRVLYRTCKSMKDYTGGVNRYAKVSELDAPAFINELLAIMR